MLKMFAVDLYGIDLMSIDFIYFPRASFIFYDLTFPL